MCWPRSSAAPPSTCPFAAMAACGALWELLGYFEVPAAYHTMIYAVLGVAVLAVSRALGIEQVVVDRYPDPNTSAIRGKGLRAFQVGNAIVSVALLAAFLQGLMHWASHKAELPLVVALAMAIFAAIMAAGLVPAGAWRRWYTTAAIGMAGVTFLTLDVLHRPELVAKGGDLLCERRHPAGRGQLHRPLP